MNSARFLLCRSCSRLHPIGVDPLPEADEDADDERRAFESEHAGHPLEEAVRSSASTAMERPVWDPMATLWFFVRSGAEELLVRASRDSIEEPRRYQIELEPPHAEALVEFDAPLVRRALDGHFYPHVVPARKLDHFVDAMRDLIADLDGTSIETSWDDPDYADAGIAPLPEVICHELLERCAAIFDPWELERLADFVAVHRRAEGALALRVHRTLAALSA